MKLMSHMMFQVRFHKDEQTREETRNFGIKHLEVIQKENPKIKACHMPSGISYKREVLVSLTEEQAKASKRFQTSCKILDVYCPDLSRHQELKWYLESDKAFVLAYNTGHVTDAVKFRWETNTKTLLGDWIEAGHPRVFFTPLSDFPSVGSKVGHLTWKMGVYTEECARLDALPNPKGTINVGFGPSLSTNLLKMKDCFLQPEEDNPFLT